VGGDKQKKFGCGEWSGSGRFEIGNHESFEMSPTTSGFTFSRSQGEENSLVAPSGTSVDLIDFLIVLSCGGQAHQNSLYSSDERQAAINASLNM
jgi:hypothetical protein